MELNAFVGHINENFQVKCNHELYLIITSVKIIKISLFDRITQPENKVTKGPSV